VDLQTLGALAALLITLTSLLLLMSGDWRLSIGLLALQYLAVAGLVLMTWPLVMASTRLIAGWMAGTVLSMALVSLPSGSETIRDLEAPSTLVRGRRLRRLPVWLGLTPGPVFYLLTALLVGLAVLSQIPRLMDWLPALELAQAWGSLILIGMGLIKLSFSSRPLHFTLALLSMFSGFEILYAVISSAALTAALTAAITLGIALAGSYLLMAPYMEASE
jgi:hypothetical protein